MTDILAQVRAVALQLPGASARAGEDGVDFLVEDRPFARVRGDAVDVLDEAGDGAWTNVPLNREVGGEIDWTLMEDRIARSWEFAAPAGLLEAGGR